MSKDLEHCWNQAAAEDEFSGQLEQRINDLNQRAEIAEGLVDRNKAEPRDELMQVSSEISMTHDHTSGIHYYIVESGGYLRNGLGLSHQQWVHSTTPERANLVAPQTMGSVEYMRLVRRRGNPNGRADNTDSGNAGEPESGTNDHDMEVEPAASSSVLPSAEPQTVEGMVELLKTEHAICLERGEFWDANAIQNLILEFLQGVRDGISDVMLARCKGRMFEVFAELGSKICTRREGMDVFFSGSGLAVTITANLLMRDATNMENGTLDQMRSA